MIIPNCKTVAHLPNINQVACCQYIQLICKMFSITKLLKHTHLWNMYYMQICTRNNLKQPLMSNLKFRSFHCFCPQNHSSSIIKQIQSSLICVNKLSITTEIRQSEYQSDSINNLSHQLLQCIIASDAEGAFKCLKTMHSENVPIRCHYFWPLIIQMHAQYGEQGVLDVLDRMLALNTPVDHDTLGLYLCPRLNLSDPLLAIRKLQDRNLKVQQLLTPVCVCLLQDGRIEEMVALCLNQFPRTKLNHEDFVHALVDYYIASGDVQTTVQLMRRASTVDNAGDVFLTRISQSKNPLLDVEKVQVVVTEFLKSGIHFSSDAMYDLKCYFSRHKLSTSDFTFYEKTSHRTPPRVDVDRPVRSLSEMSTAELEHRLISMRSRHLDPGSVLKRLLFRYCQEKQFVKAREVKHELQRLGTPFTRGMQSSCIDICIHFNEADEASEILSHLVQSDPSFRVDAYKILDLARLYAQKGEYQKAFSLVSSTCPRAGFSVKPLEPNCRQLLASIHNEDHLLGMFHLLCESKLCAPTSTPILSTIIRYFLNSNNLDKAVAYFAQFSASYRKTPLQHELLCACVAQHKPDQCRRVLQLHTRLHGPASAAVFYVTALSELGRDETLRAYVTSELVTTPQFITKMTNQIQRIADENKTDSLTLLAEVFRNSEDLIDHIYVGLLQIYCRRDANVEIERLQEAYGKIKKPSEKFSSIINSRLQIKPFPT